MYLSQIKQSISLPRHVPLISFPWLPCEWDAWPHRYKADDQQRPIPTSLAPCVVNLSIPSIIIVISNNSWCRLWPAVVMLMAIFPFDSSTTVGVNFAPTVATQCLWFWPSSLYCRIHYGTRPSDTSSRLTKQVPTGSAGRWSVHPSLLSITAFYVIPHKGSMLVMALDNNLVTGPKVLEAC